MGTTGVVLAGGASRRFGSDKRLVPIDGVPLLRRAVDTVAAVCDEVVVATAADRPLPPELELPPGVRVVVDAAGDAGPLAGLAAGFTAAAHDVVVVLGGDHGWADPSTLTRLCDTLRSGAPTTQAAVLEVDGRLQPLAAAYRRSVSTVVRARLDTGDRRAAALLDDLEVVVVEGPGAARTARDVDEPGDLDPATRTGTVHITRITSAGEVEPDVLDLLAGEEPLRILLAGPGQTPIEVTTTMRTPGSEVELAVGLLHGEGLLRPGEVTGQRTGDVLADARPDDTLVVEVSRQVDPTEVALRHLPATASCGVCGRASIDDLLTRLAPLHDVGPVVPWEVLATLPDQLRDRQRTFDATGGLHATGIATAAGDLVTVREDVGRHNALDAAIGSHVLAGTVPLTDHLVVLSGRVGFELVQKVAAAGATVIVAVGAPSDLAVRTAAATGVTLCGFVRCGGGNIYTHPRRVRLDGTPTAR